MKYLSNPELQQLLGAIVPNDPFAVRDRAMLELLLHTGLRVGELCALNVGHVWVDGVARHTLDLSSSIGKGGQGRLIPLNATARQAVETLVGFSLQLGAEAKADEPLILSKGHQRMCVRAVQYVVAGLRKRSKIDVVATPHTMRHSFCTNLLAACGNTRVVQVIAGHKRLSSTQIYTQPSRESMAAAVELLAE
jgi:site-specific recombinase XerD